MSKWLRDFSEWLWDKAHPEQLSQKDIDRFDKAVRSLKQNKVTDERGASRKLARTPKTTKAKK